MSKVRHITCRDKWVYTYSHEKDANCVICSFGVKYDQKVGYKFKAECIRITDALIEKLGIKVKR